LGFDRAVGAASAATERQPIR